MDGISRSRGWDKEIPHGVLPMEQLVLSDKWAKNFCLELGKKKLFSIGNGAEFRPQNRMIESPDFDQGFRVCLLLNYFLKRIWLAFIT